MLIETWYPVTHDFGLIQAPVDQVVSGLLDWHHGIGIDYVRSSFGGFAQGLQALAPLSAEKRRALLVPTTAGWTGFFQSGIQGSDPFPAMSFLAVRLGVQAMRICTTPADQAEPAVMWEVYAPAHLGGNPFGYRRAIAASREGSRWTFDSTGVPFEFEDLRAYESPRKKDRFTRPMLDAYLAHFGLSPFTDAFYNVSPDNPAHLLEKRKRWDDPPTEFSLEQVVAGVPWMRASTT